MKIAKITAAPAGQPAGFAWSWRCTADNTKSKGTFAFYYDCVTDARERGYHVELEQASGMMAPAGPRYVLGKRGD